MVNLGIFLAVFGFDEGIVLEKPVETWYLSVVEV